MKEPMYWSLSVNASFLLNDERSRHLIFAFPHLSLFTRAHKVTHLIDFSSLTALRQYLLRPAVIVGSS